MNVSDLLNPITSTSTPRRSRCISTPMMNTNPTPNKHRYYQAKEEEEGKPRSRFSEYEDNIIRNGVAQRLTWGQISDLLPHRKRATCFNRYRTLQGIRKSRKNSNSSQESVSSPTLDNTTVSSNSSSSDEEEYHSQLPPLFNKSNLDAYRISLPSIHQREQQQIQYYHL